MKARKVEIFMFVDALGWEIVNRFHFMEKELPCRHPVRMQFGYSCSAVPTILSGCRPREHGHLSFFYYDRQHSPFRLLGLLPLSNHPKAPWNRGRVRGWISRLVKFCFRYTGYFQLYQMPFNRLKYFNYCEKKDVFVPHGLDSVPNLADCLTRTPLRWHISDWRTPEETNLSVAEKLLEQGETDFYFIYTAALDALLHFQIRNPEAIAGKLRFYEQHIRKMLDVLKRNGQDYSFTVISDHGMTPLTGTADLKNTVEKLPLKFGTDYAACYDSTLFRVWYLKDSSRPVIRKAVGDARFPGHWLSEEEKARYGIDFTDHKYGDDIFLLDAGRQIVPSDMGLNPLPGMHGFLPEDRDSTAVILSTSEFEAPEEVADYFKLMRERIDALVLAKKQA